MAEETKIENWKLARLYLSGGTLEGGSPQKLAGDLRKEEAFSYAAEMYLKLLETCDSQQDRKGILQHLAFCFYKDPDLPSATKFEQALRYLREIDDDGNLDSEILGKLGATFKYRWYNDNRFDSLLQSRHFYQKGYELWKSKQDNFLRKAQDAEGDTSAVADPDEDKDAGYNAINYAFVLDLMAFVRFNMMRHLPDAPGESANRWREEAKKVRTEIIEYIPKLEAAINTHNQKYTHDREVHRKVEHWVYPTLGEAHFALQNYREAEHNYRTYAEGSIDEHDPEKRNKPLLWEIKTTAKQMLAYAEFFIARKRSELETSAEKKEKEDIQRQIKACEQGVQRCYAALYSCDEKSVPLNSTRGKVGLGLSGGGFRAAFFHIGVLASLAERDVLRHVEVLSCVSGGSIVGAYYYLLLKQKLEEKKDAAATGHAEMNDQQLTPADYVDIVQKMEVEFLKGVQTNLRMRILDSFYPNLKIFLAKDYSRTSRLAELYESELYRKIVPPSLANATDDDNPMLMHNLKITPINEQGEKVSKFKPKEDNWRRHHKVPSLVLNATSLNTGHNWQFTASWMGEPPANIRPDIDSKPRLRRMYYDEAPKPYKNNVRLGTAVGASSCVPALFTPVHFPDLYENQDLHLVDGGVHDNQGIASLLEQECKVLIISDASGQLSSEKVSADDMIGSFWRSDSILQARVRESQFLDLRERASTGQLSRLSIVHLTKDLQANPIKWKYCEDPTRQQWLAAHDGDNISKTTYNVLQDVQEALAQNRTDLDAFNDAEAYALMYSGYRQMEHDFEKQKLSEVFDQTTVPSIKNKRNRYATSTQPPPEVNPWEFMTIEPYMTIPSKAPFLLKRLELGKKQAFRSVKIVTWLRVLLYAVVAVLAVGVLIGFFLFWKKTLVALSVSALGIFLVFKMLGHMGGPLVSKVLGWKTVAFEIVMALVTALVVRFYLAFIGPYYLEYGKVANLENPISFGAFRRWWRRWVG
jgi:predicted acylesterase/phospholipase RssA